MANALGRLLLLAGVLAFGIFFGISLASSGIEQIHGPLTASSTKPDTISEEQVEKEALEEPGHALNPQQRDALSASQIEPVRPVSGSLLSKIFDKLGSLLNLLADYFIRLIVKLGETVLS